MKTKLKLNKRHLNAISSAFRNARAGANKLETVGIREVGNRLVPLNSWNTLTVNVEVNLDELLILDNVLKHFLATGSKDNLLVVSNTLETQILVKETIHNLLGA